MITKILGFLKGKKTYIVAILIAFTGALNYLGTNIPDYVWLLLNALGLGAVRDALPKKED